MSRKSEEIIWRELSSKTKSALTDLHSQSENSSSLGLYIVYLTDATRKVSVPIKPKINSTDVLSYIIKNWKKYRSQEPCLSKQKQTSVWESSIETVRHEVQNREREWEQKQTKKLSNIWKYKNNLKISKRCKIPIRNWQQQPIRLFEK